jgi:hypothetical protein
MAAGGRVAVCRRAAGALALVAAFAGHAAENPSDRVIRYDQDALTVRLVGVPVLEVLTEIGRQSGAEIRGVTSESRDVTASFEAVPLPQALSRLLGDQNYALIYGSGGKLRTLRLLGGSGDAVVLTAAPPPLASKDPTPLLEHRVRVTGPLADALKSPMVSLKEIGELWLHSEDASLREESATNGLRAVEAEPDLRNSLVELTQSYSDAELANFLRAIAGSRAEELAASVIAQTHVTELHMKATSVLRVLQSGSGG